MPQEHFNYHFCNPLTLGPTYNEFGYKEHLATTSRFLYIKKIDCNVEKFSYNEQPTFNEQFLLHHFTRKWDPVQFHSQTREQSQKI